MSTPGFPPVRCCNYRHQGLAVLLLLLVLLTGSLAHLLGSHALGGLSAAESQAKRVHRLNQAKQALIAYSVSYADNYLPGGAGPGHLPCPDRSPIDDGVDSNDGPDPPCSRVATLVGRFPRFTWSRDKGDQSVDGAVQRYGSKRLVFYAHRSLKDEQMWYAVSRSHVNNPSNLAVNPATEGWLEVDGRRDIVAVIIDPGRGLSVNQGVRPGDGVRAYLEGNNADGDLAFSQPDDETLSNDLLVSITRNELMPAVMQRVGLFVTRQLLQFREKHCDDPGGVCFPAAGDGAGVCSLTLHQGLLPLYPGDCSSALVHAGLLEGVDARQHWFVRNNWLAFVHYTREPGCENDTGRKCRIRLSIDPAVENNVVVLEGVTKASPLIRIHVEPGSSSS